MIHPGVIIYQQRADLLNKDIDGLTIPLEKTDNSASGGSQLIEHPKGSDIKPYRSSDSGIIDQIRSQPKPNEISERTESYYKEDIQQMVKLLGSYCKQDSINEISSVIKEINNTLNDKDIPEVKNWIRLLTGLHPEIDKQIKEYGWWRIPHSDVIGTSTLLYHAAPNSIDITFWAEKPMFTDNQVKWFASPWTSPSYLRESVRHKLDTGVVELIQNANHLTTKHLRRNLIWDATLTTAPLVGAEVRQARPIPEDFAHGVSLNNDWYHNYYRIMDGADGNKHMAWHDTVTRVTEDEQGRCGEGYYIHVLINNIAPLNNDNVAQAAGTFFDKGDLGVEDTFPLRGPLKNQIYIDHSGQKLLNKPGAVNNDVLKPEIITGE